VIEAIEESAFTLRLKIDAAGAIAECEMLIVRQSDSGIKFENPRYWDKPILHREVVAPVPRDETKFDAGAKYHIPGNTPYTRYFLARIALGAGQRTAVIAQRRRQSRRPRDFAVGMGGGRTDPS
jgi:hypothetical protein